MNNLATYLDLAPGVQEMKKQVWAGLARPRKTIHPKFLYDQRGSELFERICRVPAYYPTRAELEILLAHAGDIGRLAGEGVVLIEPGAGACTKVRVLLPSLNSPAAYVPVEISREMLVASAASLQKDFPDLRIVPICADYTSQWDLPLIDGESRLIFFPGSTIGNMDPVEAAAFLRSLHRIAGPGGKLLIGVDKKKNRKILNLAYDDPEGVTAAFNLNLLTRLNRELGAQFDLDTFRHRAFYNEEKGRVEMHLVSQRDQLVPVGERVFSFRQGESIHTESSYKYSVPEFTRLAFGAGFELKTYWTDSRGLFAVYFFEA